MCCFIDEYDIASLVLGPEGGWIRIPGPQSKNFICTRDTTVFVITKCAFEWSLPRVDWTRISGLLGAGFLKDIRDHRDSQHRTVWFG